MTAPKVEPESITLEELAALNKEMDYLDPASGVSEQQYFDAAVAGPCFCVGKFTCTKHLIERDRK